MPLLLFSMSYRLWHHAFILVVLISLVSGDESSLTDLIRTPEDVCSFEYLAKCHWKNCPNEAEQNKRLKQSCFIEERGGNERLCKASCLSNQNCHGLELMSTRRRIRKRFRIVNTCRLYSCSELDSVEVFPSIKERNFISYNVQVISKCVNEENKCNIQGDASKIKPGLPSGKGKSSSLNIVFSLVDDMGWTDIGYGNPKISTPFLDSLANSGIKLDRLYTFRFCAPSRSMLMTGKLPWRHGQHTDLNLNPVVGIRCGVQKEMLFLPEHLKRNGYQTYAVGKWHLGHHSILHTPTYRGFDSFVGVYSGGIPAMNTEEYSILNNRPCWCRGRSCKQYGQRTQCVSGYDLVNSTKNVLNVAAKKLFKDAKFADFVLAQEAVRMIENHNPAEGPMFLYTSWFSPHNPILAPESYRAKNPLIQDRCRKTFAGMMSAVDEANKRVVNALKAKGIWEKTLFIFASDNGGFSDPSQDCPRNGLGRIFKASNYPLRGSKFTFWEGGIRVRSFIHSPSSKVIPVGRRGKTWGGLVSMTDWFETINTAVKAVESQKDATVQAEDSISFWEQIIKDQPSLRERLDLQVWKEPQVERYVALETVNGVLYKYIKGYPGFANSPKLGYLQTSMSKTSMDKIVKPGELDPDPDIYSSTIYSCLKSPCLFDLFDDPSEQRNLLSLGEDKYIKIAENIQDRMLLLADTEQVTLPKSGLCEKNFVNTKHSLFLDKGAFNRVKFCGYFLPWLDEGLKLIPNSV